MAPFLPSGAMPPVRSWTGLVITAAGLPALTALLVALRGHVALESVVLLYLLAVIVAAVVGGILPAVIAALASLLLMNFFFTTPHHTFIVDQQDSIIALIVFVIVAVTVSFTVDLAARNRVVAARSQVEARELAEIDRVRSALLAAVGHDLRTPLAGIKAAVSSLRQGDVSWTPVEEKELLATIDESADRLDGLIANLLAMSRLQAGALSIAIRPTALDEVVATALLGQVAGDVVIEVPDDLPLALADPGLLERVISNLVSNAIRFSPARSPVRLTAEHDEKFVRLRVVDSGPGVPEGEWARMFAPFQRLGDRTTGGVGLGLAIARGFSDAIGATLTPSHTPGGGLTMTVTLPVAG